MLQWSVDIKKVNFNISYAIYTYKFIYDNEILS